MGRGGGSEGRAGGSEGSPGLLGGCDSMCASVVSVVVLRLMNGECTGQAGLILRGVPWNGVDCDLD